MGSGCVEACHARRRIRCTHYKQPMNILFEDIPFASVREIINQSETIENVKAGISRFMRDPDKFDSNQEAGQVPD